jgi:hypothetical protein
VRIQLLVMAEQFDRLALLPQVPETVIDNPGRP